jgi:hypothetical protein
MRQTNEDDEKKQIRYICRVACLANLAAPPVQWQGPLSKIFLASTCHIMELSRNLRNLIEMIALSMCINGEAERHQFKALEWSKIGLRYPTHHFNLDSRLQQSCLPVLPSSRGAKSNIR